jgi:cytoskeletal protein CcmA (bactofilin family)
LTRDPAAATLRAMPALQPVPPQGEINTLLGKGSSFDGKLTFEGTVRIDGKLSGEIFSDNVLVVGESAEVKAKIEVGTLIVEGRVEGNIRATQLVELHAPAKVRGNIETPSLFIDKGVIFEGACKMENLSPKTGASGTVTAAIPKPNEPPAKPVK